MADHLVRANQVSTEVENSFSRTEIGIGLVWLRHEGLLQSMMLMSAKLHQFYLLLKRKAALGLKFFLDGKDLPRRRNACCGQWQESKVWILHCPEKRSLSARS